MANLFLLWMAAFLTLIAGCSYGYKATGSLGHPAIALTGKADLSNRGGGRFNLNSPGNELMCEGYAEAPEAASSQAGCAGESGNGTLRCSDGRTIAFRWNAIGCRAFEGSGNDRDGRPLRFSVRRDRS